MGVARVAARKMINAQGPAGFSSLLFVADKVVVTSKRISPVRTGHLRSTVAILDTNENKVEIDVGAMASYAGFVEWGTSRQSAQPFMRIAIDKHTKEVGGIYVKKIARLAK